MSEITCTTDDDKSDQNKILMMNHDCQHVTVRCRDNASNNTIHENVTYILC